MSFETTVVMPRVRQPSMALIALLIATASAAAGLDVRPPLLNGSVRFAVIGDSGTGSRAQYDVGKRLAESRQVFPFDFVLMVGDNLYERLKPQKGISHFISGSAAKLRKGNIRSTEITAAGLDTDYSFMLIEIASDVMHFQTISRAGTRVDAGTVRSADDAETSIRR